MAKYTDIKATSLVAAHTIGKSIITAPLEIGENIDDIAGPAHDNVSFDSRMLELMITGPEGSNNITDYTLQDGGKLRTIGQLCDGTGVQFTDILPTNKNLICVPETFYEIGDVIFYNPTTNKFSKVPHDVFIEQWSDTGSGGTWPQKWVDFTLNNIPIGIIVIPTRLDVYGDGSALMASIRPITPGKPAYYHWTGQRYSELSRAFATLTEWWDNDPDRNSMAGGTYDGLTYPNIESYGIAWALNGSYSENTNYTYSKTPLDSILMPLITAFKWLGTMFMIYESVNYPLAEASILNDSTLNDNTGHSQFPNSGGAVPIYYDSTLQGLDAESDDRIRYINAGTNFKIKSLITKTNSGQIIKNPNQFDHLIASNGEKNAMMDFNGYDNTKILQEINQEEAWQNYVIYNFNAQNYANYEQNLSTLMPFPAMAQVWEFYTPGTNRGDWYMPSLGEMGFIMRELNPNSRYQYLSILRDCYVQGLGVCGVPTYQKTNPLGPIYNNSGNLPTQPSVATCWCTSSIMYDPDFNEVGLYAVSYYSGKVIIIRPNSQMRGILPVMRVK